MKSSYWNVDVMQKIFWIVGGALVLIQIGAYLANSWFGVGGSIKLGLGFMLIIILGVIMVPLILMMRAQRQDITMSKINMFIMLISAAILIFLLLNIKTLVPEIFTAAVYDLQSIFGMV